MKIKRLNKNQLSSLLLRIGLAFVFAYAAVGSLTHPGDWIGYLPPFLLKLSYVHGLLKLFAVFEIVLAVWLLSNRYVRYAGAVCAAMLLGIVLAQPSVFIVTFRDIGLLFMAISLVVIDD